MAHAGFQLTSKTTTFEADWRLRPVPPARVDRSMTKLAGEVLYSSTMLCRCPVGTEPTHRGW